MKKGEKMSEGQKEKLRMSHKGMTGLKHKPETIERIRKTNLGKKHNFTQEGKKKLIESQRSRVPPNKGKKWSEWMTPEGQKKSLIHLKIGKKGSKHWNWKGGIQKIKRPRDTFEYKAWRKAVFERDRFQCIWDGKEHGYKIVADHIKPWIDYPELRLAIDNGRTLCVNCHKKTETYGFKLMWSKIKNK